MAAKIEVAEGEHSYDDLPGIIHTLLEFTPATEEYGKAVDTLLESGLLISRFQSILKTPVTESYRGAVVVAEFIAELAKAENARLVMYNHGLIPLLVPLLSYDNNDLCLQIIRALGNLCYEQDLCREQIIECDGLEKLDKLLKLFVSQPITSLQLKTLCSAFIHNLLNGNEVCVKAVLKTDIVESLKGVLERNAISSPSIANFCVMAFTSIAEVEGGREVLYELKVPSVLVKVLINTPVKPSDDIKEEVLSLLSTLTAESDEVKLMLAESTIDMYLLRIISTLSPSQDEDNIQLVKAASELIVLVLTGDQAMNIWFDGGDGFVFASVSEWLQSSNGQLLQSAAFSIGNFARDDRNSHIIIQRGISAALYKCLDQLHDFCSDNRTAPTIHALLSALRNLAIAPNNKVQLLEQGILKHILPYMDSENSVVTSKLVGVLRLLVDKQEAEATYLGNIDLVVQKLVSFGNTQSNMLLKGESTRCLAWIIKNSRDKHVLQNMVNCGAFKHLIFLVQSEHTIMQNEGLISIVLLATNLPDEAKKLAEEHKLSQVLVEMLNKEELPAREVLLNVLTLFMELIKIGLSNELRESKLSQCIGTLLVRLSSDESEGKAVEELINAVKSSLSLSVTDEK